MSKSRKKEYNNKIKLLQDYKDSFESNESTISRKDLLEYILQELQELKKKIDNKSNNLTVDELLDEFENTKLNN